MSSLLLQLPDELLVMVIERVECHDFLSTALSCRRLAGLCEELRCTFLARSYALPITPMQKLPFECHSTFGRDRTEGKEDNRFQFLLEMSCFRFLSIFCGTNGNENWAFHATDASYRHIPLAFQVSSQTDWCLRPDHSADRLIEYGTTGIGKPVVMDEQKLLVDSCSFYIESLLTATKSGRAVRSVWTCRNISAHRSIVEFSIVPHQLPQLSREVHGWYIDTLISPEAVLENARSWCRQVRDSRHPEVFTFRYRFLMFTMYLFLWLALMQWASAQLAAIHVIQS